MNIGELLQEATKDVRTAEQRVETAEQRVETAEQDVRTAEQDVRTAEQRVETARNRFNEAYAESRKSPNTDASFLDYLSGDIRNWEESLEKKEEILKEKKEILKEKKEILKKKCNDLEEYKEYKLALRRREKAVMSASDKSMDGTPAKSSQRESTGLIKVNKIITEYIQRSRIDIRINNVQTFTKDELLLQLEFFSTDADIKGFVAEYDSDRNDEADKWARIFKEKLYEHTEKVCQCELSKAASKLDAIDTSSRTCYRFMHADGEVRYNLSAKPDLTFNHSCGAHEIKPSTGQKDSTRLVDSDYELLAQMLHRLYTIRNCHAFYNTAWVTGCTARSAWFVIFRRDISQFGKAEYETIDVLRIEHNMIYKIWRAYEAKASSNQFWYYTEHAPYLLRSINCFCDPWFAITRLVARSMSYVYTVSLPQCDGTTYYATQVPDFALKVITKEEDYVTERDALSDIVPAYNKECGEEDGQEDVHYALGFYDKMEAPPDTGDIVAELKAVNLTFENNGEDARKQQVNRSERFKNTLKLRQFVRIRGDESSRQSSHSIKVGGPLKGGVILMKHGAPIAKLKKDVVVGVLKSVRIAHSVNWCHTDIRLSNIMRFGQHTQLIDYGFACRVSGPFIFGEGCRYDLRGPRLKKCELGDVYNWEICDDYEMLVAALMNEYLNI